MAIPAYGILASVLVNVAWLAWCLVIMLGTLGAGGPIEPETVFWLVAGMSTIGITSYFAARGALAMLQLRDYRAAIRGAWFAIVPCNVGCLVALPFAIYADWVLRDPEVHAFFAPGPVRLRPDQPASLE